MFAMWLWKDMNASRPSRPTTMYDASTNHGIPSAGVCVLMHRRWVCASSRARTESIGSKRLSSHGAMCITGPGASPSGKSSATTMVCIQVVPHFGGVHTKMSPARPSKSAQRRLS
jgi:hypothetical protein